MFQTVDFASLSSEPVKLLSCVWLFAIPWIIAYQGSPIHGIFQARLLEWVAISFSRGSSWPRGRTCVSCIAGGFFTPHVMREEQRGNLGSSCGVVPPRLSGGSNPALEDCSSGPVLDQIFSLLQHVPDCILPRWEKTSSFPCPIHPHALWKPADRSPVFWSD